MGIDGSSLVRLLDMLESRGHIERHPSPDDRRVKLVMLTLTGRKAAGAIRSHLNSIEQEMLQDLDDEQLATCRRTILRPRHWWTWQHRARAGTAAPDGRLGYITACHPIE